MNKIILILPLLCYSEEMIRAQIVDVNENIYKSVKKM
jgi:hypothetical protein